MNDVFLYMKIVFISANRADPDEMPPYAAFHHSVSSLFGKVPAIKRIDITFFKHTCAPIEWG